MSKFQNNGKFPNSSGMIQKLWGREHASYLPNNPSWGKFYLGLDMSKIDPEYSGLRLVWYGGHVIHVYEGDKEIDIFNVGSFSDNEATIEEVVKGMLEWAEDRRKHFQRRLKA
jgi:hypothetical protein